MHFGRIRTKMNSHMWQQFVDKVTQYPDAPIYHYGSYEPRAIATLAKRYQTDAESVHKAFGQCQWVHLRESLLSGTIKRIEGHRAFHWGEVDIT